MIVPLLSVCHSTSQKTQQRLIRISPEGHGSCISHFGFVYSDSRKQSYFHFPKEAEVYLIFLRSLGVCTSHLLSDLLVWLC